MINNERGDTISSGNVNVGIGFATGRKNFHKVLKTNIYNWIDSGLTTNRRINLNLFVAYDLAYQNTKSSDFTTMSKDLASHIDDKYFIGNSAIQSELGRLIELGVITQAESILAFGQGYAEKRNAIMYFAIKNKMDYLVFFDDDEYPMAVTNTRNKAVWSGQQVLSTHLQFIARSDITHGHHCGYISPIPQLDFDETLTEDAFRVFIEAISNDIVKWEKIKSIMASGGVTYADTSILMDDEAVEVDEVNHAKFISGANLCLNLTDPQRIFPFYNPPGARGEDTFLGTCLQDRTVLRVPSYTFHDGFSTYRHLLDGVLPTSLKSILPNDEQIVTRFYKACIGWARYKPLLMYITDREGYEEKVKVIIAQLNASIPAVCEYFKRSDFKNITIEFQKFHKSVVRHFDEFQETQRIWTKIMTHLATGTITD